MGVKGGRKDEERNAEETIGEMESLVTYSSIDLGGKAPFLFLLFSLSPRRKSFAF